MSGFHQIEQIYPDQVVTDNFRVVRKLDSQTDDDGNCYDWYEIDRHYRFVDKSGPVAEQVNQVNAAAGITFVTMAEAGGIDAVTASEHADLFAEWTWPVDYKGGQIRRDPADGNLYQVIQGKDHTSQEDWPPHSTPSLWNKIADPAEEWPEWSQPVGAHDAYGLGAKVSHNGQHWISDYDNNVWEPGQFGWHQADDE